MALLSAPFVSEAGLVMDGGALLDELRTSRLLPTGCSSADTHLLRGGLREGTVVELCGPAGSGKTQLCFSAVAETAARHERVLYIDTACSFSATRLSDMLRALGVHPDAVPAALDRVQVARAHDAFALLDVLSAACRGARPSSPSEASPLADPAPPQPPPRLCLVVLDSASAAAAPLLGRAPSTLPRALLGALGSLLRAVALRARVPVLVTNAALGSGEARHPALGAAWTRVPHTRLVLERVEGSGAGGAGERQREGLGRGLAGQTLVRATLARSSIMPGGSVAWFAIDARGVRGCKGPGE